MSHRALPDRSARVAAPTIRTPADEEARLAAELLARQVDAAAEVVARHGLDASVLAPSISALSAPDRTTLSAYTAAMMPATAQQLLADRHEFAAEREWLVSMLASYSGSPDFWRAQCRRATARPAAA